MALLLNLTFWRPGDGGDVLVDRHLPADVVAGGGPLVERQCLHAAELAIDHPATGERLVLAAPLPADMQRVLDCLRQAR